jgi:hypothetical protein
LDKTFYSYVRLNSLVAKDYIIAPPSDRRLLGSTCSRGCRCEFGPAACWAATHGHESGINLSAQNPSSNIPFQRRQRHRKPVSFAVSNNHGAYEVYYLMPLPAARNCALFYVDQVSRIAPIATAALFDRTSCSSVTRWLFRLIETREQAQALNFGCKAEVEVSAREMSIAAVNFL